MDRNGGVEEGESSSVTESDSLPVEEEDMEVETDKVRKKKGSTGKKRYKGKGRRK